MTMNTHCLTTYQINSMKSFLHSVFVGMMAVMLISLVSCNEKKEPANQGGNEPTEDTTPDDKSHDTPPPAIVVDNCGNKYGWVKIGDQYWMSENMRCYKYGSKSEWTSDDELKPSETTTMNPYYLNASDKKNWYKDVYAKELSADQIAKLGYLYNWAAAMGFSSEAEAKAQTSEFSGKRQGICPDGWHVPSLDEWSAFKNFIEKTDGKGEKTAGKHLKSKSGWKNGEGNGVDTYSFNALPAFYTDKSNVVNYVGLEAMFWVTRPTNANEAFVFDIKAELSELAAGNYKKYGALSVRCIWD